MLVELIRKVEDTPGINLDMRQMALALTHRFRLDGIERAPGVIHPGVTPFSPSGFQFSKHRLLLSRLLPGNAINFPNGTLTTPELVSASTCNNCLVNKLSYQNSVHSILCCRIQLKHKLEMMKRKDVVN